METILKIENIEKYYGNKSNITKAIDNISFSVEKGEYVAIMGASGSGKTTLLNCISTIDRVSSGHIYVGRDDITKLRGNQLNRFRREELGFIFQDFNLLEQRTVLSNVAFPLMLAGEKKELLYQVCLDGKGKLLSCRCISKGSVGASPVYVRQVVENALYAGASGIILAHNHPSGVALPSAEDRMVTHQVMEALEPLGIRLIDHIVVADNDFVSMAESKLM